MQIKHRKLILFALVLCFCSLVIINNSYCLDDIQNQYINNLSNINAELENIYQKYYKYQKLYALNQELKIINLKSSGKISPEAERQETKYRDEEESLKKRRKELKNDKNSLKLDALKFYKGKMPAALKKKWDEEEKRHSKCIDPYNSSN